MKAIFILLTCVCVGCSTDTTQNQIKNYIKQNINDPSSYEPVSFGEKQNDSTKYNDDGVMNLLEDSAAYFAKLHDIYEGGPYDSLHSIMQQENEVNDKIIVYLHNYKNKPDGYKVQHIFRRKNKAGGVVLDTINFRFDSSMNLRNMNYKKEFNKD